MREPEILSKIERLCPSFGIERRTLRVRVRIVMHGRFLSRNGVRSRLCKGWQVLMHLSARSFVRATIKTGCSFVKEFMVATP